MDTLSSVREFHEAFCPDQANLGDWREPSKQLSLLRLQLIQEEVGELAHALASNDKVAVLDALVDLQYVIDGAFLAFGLDKFKNLAFSEVHASNMSKLDEAGKPILDEAGRVCKGQNYFKPNLEKLFTDSSTRETDQ